MKWIRVELFCLGLTWHWPFLRYCVKVDGFLRTNQGFAHTLWKCPVASELLAGLHSWAEAEE